MPTLKRIAMEYIAIYLSMENSRPCHSLKLYLSKAYRGGSRILGKGVHMYKGVMGSLC